MLLSLLLHGGIAYVLLFGLPAPKAPPPVIPVEVVFELEALPEPQDTLPSEEILQAEKSLPVPDISLPEPQETAPSLVGLAVAETETEVPEALFESSPSEPIPDAVPALPPQVEETETAAEVELPPLPGIKPVVEAPVEEAPPAPETESVAEVVLLAPPPPVPARKPVYTAPEPIAEPEVVAEATLETRAVEPAEPSQVTRNEPVKREQQIVQTEQEQPKKGVPEAKVTNRSGAQASFLNRLDALKDEDFQAQQNPELWQVINLVRAQMRKCWVMDPKQARRAKSTVDIQVRFDRSGRLQKAEVQEVSPDGVG